MKLNLILLATIFFTSCTEAPQQTTQQIDSDQNWQVALVQKQQHFYNKKGLLDTTHQTQDVYANGVLGVSINFLITREYDNRNNLICEKTFRTIENKNEVIEESIYEYDIKNNPILKVKKIENVAWEITKKTYDDKNQKIEEMEIRKKFEEKPADWNLDSTLAHRNDKIHYDTSIISYQFDTEGNEITKIYRNSHREVTETITTLFSGKQKTQSFGVNSKTDTVSITNFTKNGNLISEIAHDKINLYYNNTKLYDGNRLIQLVSIDKMMNLKRKETYKYDSRGNEIENISYR